MWVSVAWEEKGCKGGPQVWKGALYSRGVGSYPSHALIPCPPLLYRRTTVSACPPQARARASVQVGEHLVSSGAGAALASLSIPGGGGWGRGGLPPQSDCPSAFPNSSHPPHPALVSRTHFPRGEPAAHRAAGPGRRVRGRAEQENRPRDRRDPVSGWQFWVFR